MYIYIDPEKYAEICKIAKEIPFLKTRHGATPKGKQKITIECRQGDLATFYHDIDLIENLANGAKALRDFAYNIKNQKLELERNGF